MTLTDSSSNIIRSPVESGGVSRLRADISLAEQLLDYAPRVDLRMGLARILERSDRAVLVSERSGEYICFNLLTSALIAD